MTIHAPTPTVKGARQFFDVTGHEYFIAEAHGRRPDVSDALRAIGYGQNRINAELAALKNWQSAWRSLHPALKVADA
jgi:hypothetical protein